MKNKGEKKQKRQNDVPEPDEGQKCKHMRTSLCLELYALILNIELEFSKYPKWIP